MSARIAYSVREFAEAMGYKTPAPIYEAIYRGEIPFLRIPPKGDIRIPAHWVESEIARQTEKR